MRRRRSPTILLLGIILPVLVSSQTYDAVPIGRPFMRPPPSPRQEEVPAPTLARGYQPPPRPSNFQPPRSYPSFQQPSLNLDNRGGSRPQFNWQMQQLQQQHPQRFQQPQQGFRTIPQTPPAFLPPQNHLRAGAPGQIPRPIQQQNLQSHQIPRLQGPQQLDPVNNIIIHLYLNAKDRMPSHTEIKTPVHGLFGIGTSHGGPGSHSDPIVITKDFDRETLEFVDEGQAKKISGPSNIIEVKATVSTPNRQLENTVNHAVNQELDRAIPKVMDRMRGSTMTMDNGMRKELEEALVDELAKNLGETIDNTEITQDDLEKLIEEGFEEVEKEQSTTAAPATVRQTTFRPVATVTATMPPRTTWTTSRPTPKLVTIPGVKTSPTTVAPEFNNDDDYFTDDSEDISQTSRGTVPTVAPTTTTTTRRPTTTTTTRIIVTSPTTTSTTRVWTRPTTEAPATRAPATWPPATQAPVTWPPATTTEPWTRPTDRHVHVMPGIRVTETSTTTTTTTTPRPTTTTTRRTTWTPPPTTSTTTTTTTSTTTQAPTTRTTTQAPAPTSRATWAPWTPPTTTSTASPYHPPTSVVTFAPEENSEEIQQNIENSHAGIPTRKPMIEVSPSIGPTHHGIVNLESNEEDYESTVTSKPVVVTTERSTALHNLPTKPSSAPTLHPSTFSPPLVTETIPLPTDTEEPFTFSLDTSAHTASTVIPTVTQPSDHQDHQDYSGSTSDELTTPITTETTSTTSTTTAPPRRYTVEEKIEVHPHTIFTEEPFFSTSSIEWNPTTSAEEETTTSGGIKSVMREDEDYDYTNEFAVFPPTTVTTTIASITSTDTNESPKPHRPHGSSSEEIQPNFVIPSGQCPTPNQPSIDRNRTDVLFLLDSSDNFNEQRFHRAITLIKDTVSKFNNFGADGVQVSLVQYNDEPYLEFSLRKHNCKKHLLDDIADTEFMTGGSQLNKALEKVSQFAFTKKRGDRPDAENVLIIVTDGQSNGRIQEPTRLAKENNVTVLVISTIEADKQFVNELSGNKAENLFGLDANEDLSWKLAQRISALSSESTLSDPKNNGILSPVLPEIPNDSGSSGSSQSLETLVTRRPENAPENSGIINLECVGDGFKIQVNPPDGFKGVAVVKGYQDDVRCKATAHSNTPLNLFISNEECGVTQVKSSDPKGLNSSLVLHLLHENDLNTAEDKAYLLQCFIGSAPDEDAVLSTNLDVVKSELAIAETISLSTLPPTCTYSIRKDGPDGSIVNKAVVGQTVWHRWECDGTNETIQAYGIQIHSCYASDDVERKFAFVDPRGCSSDLALLTDLTYADDSLTAWAASHVFNVHDAESLKFVCKLSLCTRDGDGCEGVTPPSCGNTNKTGLLLTKRLAKGLNSVDEALTSALSTNVKLSSGSPDNLVDVLKAASSNYLFFIVPLVGLAAAVAVSLHYRNVAESSETATTCSDPTTMSESQRESPGPDFGGSVRSISSPTPNPRLADFMRNFDRQRYV